MPEPDPIPISLVAHAVFCPRRAWLEAAGERVDSAQMQAGQLAHGRVDNQRESRPSELRAVDISHAGLGVIGRCDLVQEDLDGVRVVEYKATPVRRRAEPTMAQRVQLALQVMCLEEAGRSVSGAGVYFTNHKQLVQVPVGDEERAAARAWVDATRRIIGRTSAPEPLVDDPRCRSCSHVGVCLPDEHRVGGACRRISVADPDGEILHVTAPGARVSMQAGRVKVVKGDELASLPLERARTGSSRECGLFRGFASRADVAPAHRRLVQRARSGRGVVLFGRIPQWAGSC